MRIWAASDPDGSLLLSAERPYFLEQEQEWYSSEFSFHVNRYTAHELTSGYVFKEPTMVELLILPTFHSED